MSNYNIVNVPGGVPVYLWNNGVTIEDAAMKQLYNLAKMPFVYKHIAAMPDTHFGIGATVGSVFASVGAIIPAAVGVDVGCGMIAAKTNLSLSDLSQEVRLPIRQAIEKRVPMGRTNNGQKGDRGAWFNIPEAIKEVWEKELKPQYEKILLFSSELGKGNTENHLGTLGTGNHFIEIQHDTDNNIWIMLHSGSRGVGNRIGSYYIKKAKDLMVKRGIILSDRDLAYLPDSTVDYDDYIIALEWAQKFAFINSQIMLKNTLAALCEVIPGVVIEKEINTHHNYATVENHFGKDVLLTRKGAIKADKGDVGIIPGSMGAKSYIVRGLGNPLSFNSCSHGAGRAMSRTEAKKRFNVNDHIKATIGVECRKDLDVIDETPMAYKDIDLVIEAEKDLVEPIVTLKQLICCKG
jgi:tRNA-splicing ligase RtcB